jgi:hypothetical protein
MLLVLLMTGIIYAATIKYTYTGETTYLETDGYGGGASDLAADQAYDYGADIDLETNGYFNIWVFLEHDSSGTTDNIIISYFGSYDGTNFDDTPIWTVEVDASSGADEQISFFAQACPHGRIGVKTSGTTDTFDYQITYLVIRGDST